MICLSSNANESNWLASLDKELKPSTTPGGNYKAKISSSTKILEWRKFMLLHMYNVGPSIFQDDWQQQHRKIHSYLFYYWWTYQLFYYIMYNLTHVSWKPSYLIDGFWRPTNQNLVFRPFILLLKNKKDWCFWRLEQTSTCLITVFYHLANNQGHFKW